jgi:hypothetical protein
MPEPIPQPQPVQLVAPPPAVPAPPAHTRLVLANASGALELVVLHKRTYAWDSGRRPRPADEQPPLEETGALHEPLAEGLTPAWKTLPDVVGFKTGTDVVVQGSARPPRPVTSMTVAVELVRRRHEAVVFGKRVCGFQGGRLAFSAPEPFGELPLRYELAYGGRDPAYEAAVMADVRRMVGPEKMRRALPSTSEMVARMHPLMYPRNRFGLGWVLDGRPEAIAGRELPCIERPGDLLTPERLVVAGPTEWTRQPLPIGFDYLDPMTFPRLGMFACPPLGYQPGAPVREVELGLVPPDFCRGNIAVAAPAELPTLIHPHAGQCASLGLTFPFLRGDEFIALHGMDHGAAILEVQLPGERPRFSIAGVEARTVSPAAELYLASVAVDARRLTLVWAGRHRLSRALAPAQVAALAATTTVSWGI